MTPFSADFPLREVWSAAALYLEKGLAPIPLPSASKRPTHDGWQWLRVSPDNIDLYFPAGQPGNIGVLNGAPSHNLADVDLDSLEARRAAPLLLPETGWVFGRKSSPASHWIYRTDRPHDTASTKYADLDGKTLVELRGTGGQTVFPPSSHEGTGEPIAWDRFTDRGEVALRDLQEVVRELAAVAMLARHWPAKGARHDARLALAGALITAGWPQERVIRFVRAVTIAAGNDGIPDAERVGEDSAERVAEGGRTTGWPTLGNLLQGDGAATVRLAREWLGLLTTKPSQTRVARRIEPYTPFPVDALPTPLATFVREAAVALGCDPAYIALPALSVVAAAVGNTRTIRLKLGWEEPSIVWSVVIGDSGTLKTPAYLKAVGPIFRRERELLEEYRAAVKAHKDAKRGRDDGNAGDTGGATPEPVRGRRVCSDITIEKLAEILEDNERGVLVARDELAGWLGGFSRYKGKAGGTDMPQWLEMFRAGHVVVDRKTGDRKHYYVSRANTSVAGGIQPGIFARILSADFLDAGLLARLLMAMPPKQVKRWTEAIVDPATEGQYERLLDGLLALDFDLGPDGERVPHILRLSGEGKKAWVAFYDSWGEEQDAAEGDLAATLSKLEGYAARLALLHHVVTHVGMGSDDCCPVGPESVVAGITLARWFAGEARRILAMLSETTEDRDIRRLVEFVQSRGGRITARELQRSNSRKYPTASHAETALDGISPHYGDWVAMLPGPKGGHPTRAFILRPTDDTTDTTPDGQGDVRERTMPESADTSTDGHSPPPAFPGVSQGSVGSVNCRTEERRAGLTPAPSLQEGKPAGSSVGLTAGDRLPVGEVEWEEGDIG